MCVCCGSEQRLCKNCVIRVILVINCDKHHRCCPSQWSGLRRIKNCVMVLEWVPDTSALQLEAALPPSSLSDVQRGALAKSFRLFGFDPIEACSGG